jgi:sec-independent protein translocase protein TatC
MATALRPIQHDQRLSLVDHLDELRTRLIICALALVVSFGACFWQNGALLHVLNRPLEQSTPTHHSKGPLAATQTDQAALRTGLEKSAAALSKLGSAASSGLSPSARVQVGQAATGLAEAVKALPTKSPKREPITTGVGEPFTATITVAAYFALLFALPVILFQAYAFILPAFNPRERRMVMPLMMMVPVLFAAGVAFAYYLVLPPAISFLQNFNTGSFDVLIQAKDYYRFNIIVLLAIGLMFQLPVGLLALNRARILSGAMLRRQWRYAIVGIAVIAAALPGVDPVTTLLEMVPLLLLYGLSILLLSYADRRDRGAPALDEPAATAPDDDSPEES